MKNTKLAIFFAAITALLCSGTLLAVPPRAELEKFWAAGAEYKKALRADKNDQWNEFLNMWHMENQLGARTFKESLGYWLQESEQVFAKASASVEDKQAKAIIMASARVRKATIVFAMCYEGGGPPWPLLDILHEGIFASSPRGGVLYPEVLGNTRWWYPEVLAKAVTVRAFDEYKSAHADLKRLLAQSKDKAKYEAGRAIFQARGKDYHARYWEVSARVFKECPNFLLFFDRYFRITECLESPSVAETIKEWRGYLNSSPVRKEEGKPGVLPATVAKLFNPPRGDLAMVATKEDFVEIWTKSAVELEKLSVMDPAEDNFEYWHLIWGPEEPPLLVKIHRTPRSFSAPISNLYVAIDAWKPNIEVVSSVKTQDATFTSTKITHFETPKPERISAPRHEELKKRQEAWIAEHPDDPLVAKVRKCELFEQETEQGLAAHLAAMKARREAYLKEREAKRQQGGELTAAK